MSEKEYFPITSVHRRDVQGALHLTAGQTQKIPDEAMERIAGKMANDYLEQLFWSSLSILAEDVLRDYKISPSTEKRSAKAAAFSEPRQGRVAKAAVSQ